ncbi:hypothetical protein BH11VER1_BH11VER1_30860 [soil metagenome]
MHDGPTVLKINARECKNTKDSKLKLLLLFFLSGYLISSPSTNVLRLAILYPW